MLPHRMVDGRIRRTLNGTTRTGEPRVNSPADRPASRLARRTGPYPRPPMPKILVVEDEPAIVDALEFGLGAEGFDVAVATDGRRGLEVFERERPDLVLLDLMLPGLPGTEVCKRLRASSAVPIIMLTAKDSEVDKVVGLELGADDYVTKPFSLRELSARIRAVLRRGGDWDVPDPDAPLEVRGVRIDGERHEVHVRGARVDLPPKEFALLELLVRNAGRVLTRDLLIDRIWGSDYVGDTKTLDVHIKRIRGRIEADPHAPELVLTVRGVGYKFAD
jgi:two-component system, OmpR family, response regulator RegX3